ncbi:MAG: anaerobic ribonucleoside-triphosphate reductase activating protein [Candidatus Portnoybacteria bacterium CG10_big_fil_rev_8_21_14_0_10_38_18]|uniref:Anaerobic ribonucleoside-triphosphate reductase activating protein n=1 Tax=Candidatus Portnoybacteria bacterium CG10_big_fil_rev_8_21_14_0_10_38_18 TaxID=1974813 RepID=A0A2M8KCH0_9BACT|nr:MAG: anaerobic ribonucleoside-triphosphate reductase activating protein [Candidatus Portnoybacteria bacterium CG10_big_fil_rev_8_21_14_0_10_38_18]
MKIGGLQKLTLIDYPGKIAATVFLFGCNFKCPFCQNPELVDTKKVNNQQEISEKEFFDFLDSKKGLIDGICITGGEPTFQLDLIDFIKKIKNKGFLIKLDTNGSNPEILEKLIKENLLDFIAMDIKSSQNNYSKAAGVKVDLGKINKSIDLIKNSNIDYEFRTTVVPGLVGKKDIEEIGKWLKGTKNFALQQFQNKKVLDKEFEKIQPYSEETLKEFKKMLEKNIKKVELRI